MDLTVSKRMMACLYHGTFKIWRNWYSDQSIHDFIKHHDTQIITPKLKRPPSKITQHVCYTTIWCVVIANPTSCPSLQHLYFVSIFFGVRAPNNRSILYLWPNKSIVSYSPDFLVFCFNISFYKA